MCNKNTYVGLHNHSYFSLLDGLSSPLKIAKRAKEIGSPAIALTDHGSLFGMVEFQKACNKYEIKSIQGIELYICQQDPAIRTNENKHHNHLTVLAKNQDGIKELMALVSATNKPEWFYRKPRIDLINLANFAKNKNLICLSGCLVGELCESLFTDFKQACLMGADISKTNDCRKLLKPNWKDLSYEIIEKYIKIFGKENYFLELQTEGMIAQNITVECLRELSSDMNITSVSTLDSHYACRGDAEDQRILLYSQMHTTSEEQEAIRKQGGDSMAFFYLDNFYIFDYNEMKEHYTEKEIENTLLIADMIKPYSLVRSPCLPRFTSEQKTSENLTSDEYLKNICIENAKIKLKSLSQYKKQIYWQRLKRELEVIKEAKLADYFLIVWDVCNWIDKNNGPRGIGRGSGAGSLVNYLIGITGIDPLEYDLYFERFYNSGRNIQPHFDIGNIKYSEWLSKVENIIQEKIDDTRNIVKNLIIQENLKYKSIHNKKLLKEEADWIDKNNPKMWLYILEMFKNNQTMCSSSEDQVLGLEFPNPNNSHIMDSLRMCCSLDSNKSVKTNPGHISLPDIDLDIGVDFREKVIEYLKNKWGEDKVSQMITFGRLQGRAALKEVFRAQPDTVKHLMKVRATKLGQDPKEISLTPHELCNEITFFVPDEAEIVDELQQIREDTENDSYGILQWSIDHVEQVKDYYQWYKPLFDQAIRLEGTKKSQSKHAAGLAIADIPIEELVPMAYDAKSKNVVVGLEMGNAEKMGIVKFDLLGLVALDKIRLSENLINQTKE